MLNIKKLKRNIGPPEIEFRCTTEDWNVIPKPYPARKFIPKWYKDLAPKHDGDSENRCPMHPKDDKLESSSVKRCAPFLDAMQAGWIIPLAGDVEFQTNEDCSGVQYKWSFYKPLVEAHNETQTGGSSHPAYPCPPIKFLNYWSMSVPEGYSIMFVNPFNRPNPNFTIAEAIVDCDKYEEFINFPFFFTTPNFTGVLPAGTPMVQVVPIHRDAFKVKGNMRVFRDDEWEEIETMRRRRLSHESIYRDKLWVRK